MNIEEGLRGSLNRHWVDQFVCTLALRVHELVSCALVARLKPVRLVGSVPHEEVVRDAALLEGHSLCIIFVLFVSLYRYTRIRSFEHGGYHSRLAKKLVLSWADLPKWNPKCARESRTQKE